MTTISLGPATPSMRPAEDGALGQGHEEVARPGDLSPDDGLGPVAEGLRRPGAPPTAWTSATPRWWALARTSGWTDPSGRERHQGDLPDTGDLSGDDVHQHRAGIRRAATGDVAADPRKGRDGGARWAFPGRRCRGWAGGCPDTDRGGNDRVADRAAVWSQARAIASAGTRVSAMSACRAARPAPDRGVALAGDVVENGADDVLGGRRFWTPRRRGHCGVVRAAGCRSTSSAPFSTTSPARATPRSGAGPSGSTTRTSPRPASREAMARAWTRPRPRSATRSCRRGPYPDHPPAPARHRRPGNAQRAPPSPAFAAGRLLHPRWPRGVSQHVLMNVIPLDRRCRGDRPGVASRPDGRSTRSSSPAPPPGSGRGHAVGGAQPSEPSATDQTIVRVDKITGRQPLRDPGQARHLRRGRIDGVAGPSEIVVIASAGADPRLVAADLVSQLEHDPLPGRCASPTPDPGAAEALQRGGAAAARSGIIAEAAGRHGAVVVTESLDAARPARRRVCRRAPLTPGRGRRGVACEPIRPLPSLSAGARRCRWRLRGWAQPHSAHRGAARYRGPLSVWTSSAGIGGRSLGRGVRRPVARRLRSRCRRGAARP